MNYAAVKRRAQERANTENKDIAIVAADNGFTAFSALAMLRSGNLAPYICEIVSPCAKP